MMKTLVVTGGIGSGKSLVCSFFAERGVPVYDSDSRTKALYDTDLTMPYRISKSIGVNVTDSEGRIDRNKLASIVFADDPSAKARLEALESVVHPAVLEDYGRWKAAIERRHASVPFAVFESAIILMKPLFRKIADFTLLVDAPLEMRLERACARDNAGREAMRKRMANQKLLNDISEGLVKPDADYVIINDGTAEELHEKVDEFLKFSIFVNCINEK